MNRKVVHKLFWVWQFEKEEAWLNDMARQGWVLDQVGFCKFVFKRCEPGEYTVRLELLEEFPSSEKSMDYISFVEDTGAEYIGNMTRWVYFRKKTADGEFDLFSDIDSRVKHLDRIMKFVGFMAGINLLCGVNVYNRIHIVNLICTALLGYACWRVYKKKEQLQKERGIHE